MKHICGQNSKSVLYNVDKEDVQPNACDLKVARIFKFKESSVFMMAKNSKQHHETEELETDELGFYFLEPGHYEVIMENTIEVGNYEAGWVITRSTLNRNGLFLTSGLYDSGFHGNMAACLHVSVGNAYIEKGCRIGQYISFDAEMLHRYNGSYGYDSMGIAREEEKKYL